VRCAKKAQQLRVVSINFILTCPAHLLFSGIFIKCFIYLVVGFELCLADRHLLKTEKKKKYRKMKRRKSVEHLVIYIFCCLTYFRWWDWKEFFLSSHPLPSKNMTLRSACHQARWDVFCTKINSSNYHRRLMCLFVKFFSIFQKTTRIHVFIMRTRWKLCTQ